MLVAEDNPVIHRFAARMLEKRGLRAPVVTDGSQALEALKRGDYALVLMDCQMPWTATRQRRSCAGSRGAPGAREEWASDGPLRPGLLAGAPTSIGLLKYFDAVIARWLGGLR